MLFKSKNLALSSIAACMLAYGCNQEKNEPIVAENAAEAEKAQNLSYFGDTITENGAFEPNDFICKMSGKDSLNAKIKTTIAEVCQKKGCWMDVNLGNGVTMKVKFKDYGFFVPKDAANKEVIIEGTAYHETVPVEELRHYAEDAGKSKEEIAKITSSETETRFIAKGVIIKN